MLRAPPICYEKLHRCPCVALPFVRSQVQPCGRGRPGRKLASIPWQGRTRRFDEYHPARSLVGDRECGVESGDPRAWLVVADCVGRLRFSHYGGEQWDDGGAEEGALFWRQSA